jgi:hypothetical protein
MSIRASIRRMLLEAGRKRKPSQAMEHKAAVLAQMRERGKIEAEKQEPEK